MDSLFFRLGIDKMDLNQALCFSGASSKLFSNAKQGSSRLCLALQMEFITETHFTAESLGPKQVAGGEFDLIV